MSKKINISLIRSRKVYTNQTLAELFHVHIRTIQVWKREGMKPLEENSRPHLYLGFIVKEFLQKKYKRNKKKLELHQFYCVKCRKETISKHEKLRYVITDKNLGNGNKHAKIFGNCEKCGTEIFRFASDKIINKMISLKILEEEGTGLMSNLSLPLNTDINRVSKKQINEQLTLNF
ncbi:MAG TPA: hypothetical protein PK605_05295 [Ignavibacteria bacterium]|nr:hypothetical protein [Bacteroidota bacterium]HCN38322.1 hypothetical protein [Bacteroidota bacterium]HRF66832.1 hypothetical protein [Ignavibacteria bacterium]HRJ03799.1 hypothetical protein [Ignavibacteria bacterium]